MSSLLCERSLWVFKILHLAMDLKGMAVEENMTSVSSLYIVMCLV